MKNETIKTGGRSYGKSMSSKEWQDANNAGLIKMGNLCEKAQKIGGSVVWNGEITKDGGFPMVINIDI